ncbi:MAG: DUF998 domain-containing protein [Halieaceae bacterium]|jgi:hypothetical protein|nr:DUF998 domain-containing protein [Halieaceae bacterium]
MHRKLIILAVGLCLAAHLLALRLSGANPASDPISALSQGPGAIVHSAGLLALAAAWLLLVAGLWGRESRWLWRSGCALLLLCVPILLYVAYYFSSASTERLLGDHANDPLAVLASVLGVAMAALQPGLLRAGAAFARANGIILFLWIALVPVIPLIEASWLGAYERTVGALMLCWTAALALLSSAEPARTEAAPVA